MKITRDVILDLWAAYEAGEASSDTKTLVEEYLRQDVDLARILRDRQLQKEVVAVELPPDLQARTLERTKKMIKVRTWLLSLGIWFTWASFFVAVWDFERGGQTVKGTFFMWRDQPAVAAVFLIAAGCCWVAYYRVRRQLRTTSL
jgi:hypothetical protein